MVSSQWITEITGCKNIKANRRAAIPFRKISAIILLKQDRSKCRISSSIEMKMVASDYQQSLIEAFIGLQQISANGAAAIQCSTWSRPTNFCAKHGKFLSAQPTKAQTVKPLSEIVGQRPSCGRLSNASLRLRSARSGGISEIHQCAGNESII